MCIKFPVVIFLLVWLAGCNLPADNQSNLRVQISRYSESFSPVKSNEFNGIVFQFLTERDSTDKIVSNLAGISEKISINDTITLFGFRLKPSARWYDSTPVSKEDVHFTIKLNRCRLAINASTGISYLDPIKAFLPDSLDPQSFRLEVHGNPEYGRAVAGDYLVMPEHIFDPGQVLRKYDLEFIGRVSEAEAPADLLSFFETFNQIGPYDSIYFRGSGPYQIESYIPDQNITLSLTPNHWQSELMPRQLPDKINYLMITDPTAARFALQNGEVDLVTQMPATEFVQLEDFNTKTNRLNLYKQAAFKFVFVGFNTRETKFSSAGTRRALAHLLDKNAIIDAVKLGYAQPAIGPVHPVLKDLYNHDIEPYSLDLEKSKGLLQEAGWSFDNDTWVNESGEALDFTLTFNGSNDDYQKIALIVQSQAEKIGLKVNLLPEEGSNLGKKLRSHQFEAVIWSFVGSPRSFDYSPLFHTSATVPGKMNFTGFGSPASDRAIEQAILSTNREEMGVHLKELQEILHTECPMVFLYFEQNLIAASKQFPILNITYYRPGYDPVGVF